MTSTGSSSSAPPDAPATARAELVIGPTTYNSAGLLDAAADALLWAVNGGFGGVTSRVVLVDGGSTDGTADRVRALVGPERLVALDRVRADAQDGGAFLGRVPFRNQLEHLALAARGPLPRRRGELPVGQYRRIPGAGGAAGGSPGGGHRLVMTFLAPLFLAAAAGIAALVVAIHFISTREPATVPLPTARFAPDRPVRARSSIR